MAQGAISSTTMKKDALPSKISSNRQPCRPSSTWVPPSPSSKPPRQVPVIHSRSSLLGSPVRLLSRNSIMLPPRHQPSSNHTTLPCNSTIWGQSRSISTTCCRCREIPWDPLQILHLLQSQIVQLCHLHSLGKFNLCIKFDKKSNCIHSLHRFWKLQNVSMCSIDKISHLNTIVAMYKIFKLMACI